MKLWSKQGWSLYCSNTRILWLGREKQEMLISITCIRSSTSTANKSVSSKSQNPHLSESCLSLFKIINWENIPDWCLGHLLKSILVICKKSGHVPDKIPHKSPFFKDNLSFFSSKPNLSFLLSHRPDLISVLKIVFCMSQKSLKQVYQVWNSLKFALTDCISFLSM